MQKRKKNVKNTKHIFQNNLKFIIKKQMLKNFHVVDQTKRYKCNSSKNWQTKFLKVDITWGQIVVEKKIDYK